MTKDEEEIWHSQEESYSGREAYVRDFTIHPSQDEDNRTCVNAFVLMGGRRGPYYLRVTNNSVGRDCHHVELTGMDGDVLDAFEFRFPEADPDGYLEAVQVIHEAYIGPVQDWYDYAVSVEETGDSE